MGRLWWQLRYDPQLLLPELTTRARPLIKVLAYRNREVVHRFVREWDVAPADAETIFEDLLRYLWLGTRVTRKLTPPPIIDEMWHTFLLHSRAYREFCTRYLGTMVDHLPLTIRQQRALVKLWHEAPGKAKQRYASAIEKDAAVVLDELGEAIVRRWYIDYEQRYGQQFFAGRAGLRSNADRELWDEVHRSGRGRGAPNQLLVDTVDGRPPGVALDLMMGSGRNALYLATRGWDVTGVDASRVGIELAKQEAASARLRLTAIEADAQRWDLGVERWDLVTMIYGGRYDDVVARVAPSLRRGGLFVLENYANAANGWSTGELAAMLSGSLTVLRDEVAIGVADFGSERREIERLVAQKA